ncbi:FadR/GntR family transcriptional regulator [Novosphingobium sp.]|uniref:FadR/GntR family transcriptional regulator n=1 Tax=Novosphingobium sp. TaxID=1874826 RepID=UPI0025FBDB8C|nr:FadR/GntR family transcriptional regulator [Novosphingobium sp.]
MSQVQSHDRLYQELARKLFAQLASGKFKIGDRLPAERDLADTHGVSRPTVREAIIALEVQGYVDVRVGSGAYVKKLPGAADAPEFNVTAFELTEARLLIEGEAAALAATNLTDDELDQLDALVARMAETDGGGREDVSAQFAADKAFHLLIAGGTRNAAMVHAVEELWRMRASSPESALLHDKARDAKVTPVVDEHSAIVAALRSRDPGLARSAMRAHLAAVLDHLLFATEEQAVEEARQAIASKRARFSRTGLL